MSSARNPGSERDRLVLPAVRLAQGRRPADPTCLVACQSAEDDLDVRVALQGLHVELVSCQDGGRVLLETGRRRADLVILAPDVPMVDTSTIVATIRQVDQTPIIVGVAAGQIEEARSALAWGASRVLVRPYDTAQLRTVITELISDDPRPGPVRLGALCADPLAYEATLRGARISLPARELEVLLYLMLHSDRAVSVPELEESLWADDQLATGSKAVAQVILRLRQRLRDDTLQPKIIRTVRGFGYRIHPPEP